MEGKAGLCMAFHSLSPSNLPTIFQECLHFAVIKTGCATEKVVCAKARGTKGHLRDVIHLQCSGNGMKSLAFDSSSCLSPCSTTYGIGETVLLDQSLQMLEIVFFFNVDYELNQIISNKEKKLN